MSQFEDSPGIADYVERAREFFDRPPPEGYLKEWTDRLAKPEAAHETDLRSLLIFRLGAEWLALSTQFLVEVGAPQPIHSVPHRTNETLRGLVNIRGQIRLCISLHDVLVVERHAEVHHAAGVARMVIIQDRGEHWVFLVEEVARAIRLEGGKLRPPPSTLRVGVSHTRAVFEWAGRTVGELDPARLFETLRGLGS
jgi:chemotaxis-related protein WspD